MQVQADGAQAEVPEGGNVLEPVLPEGTIADVKLYPRCGYAGAVTFDKGALHAAPKAVKARFPRDALNAYTSGLFGAEGASASSLSN